MPTPFTVPTSEAELSALLAAATREGRSVRAIGNDTKTHHGPAGLAAAKISMSGLGRITAYEPGDMVVSVQAGARLADLQAALAAQGQWLPIDPPYAEATIGGILATASAGPRRFGYGPAKDHLLGLRVAGAGGVITKSGGRVVKNVTGFDLHKVHVGAMGSLGVLVEAHFKVLPLPEVAGAALFGCADLEAAHRLLLEIASSPLRPVALEALDLAAYAGLGAGLPTVAGAAAVAIVGIEGSRPVFERHARTLPASSPRKGGLQILEGEDAARLWTGFREAPERHRGQVTVRLGARPHDLPALLGEVARAAISVRVHAGIGTAHATLPRGPGPAIARVVSGWHERAAALGGYAVVEAAPLDLEGRSELPWGGASHALGRALKASFDPTAILAPGRMAP